MLVDARATSAEDCSVSRGFMSLELVQSSSWGSTANAHSVLLTVPNK